jgi:hypothetical protein
MKRREFITFLGGAVTWSVATRAQQVERMRRIGLRNCNVVVCFDRIRTFKLAHRSPARCAFEGLFIAGIVSCPDPGRRT